MPTLTQPSFAKGVLGPELHGRVDVAAYSVGLDTGRNIVVHPYGGASNRAGTVYVGPCKTHTYAPRLIEFQFKSSDSYILEFGNLYMRVIRNGGYVTEAAVNITGIASPALVTATGHGYSNGDEVLLDGIGGMTELNGRRYTITVSDANRFVLYDQVSGDAVDISTYTAYTSGGTVSRIYTLTTPYATADLDELKYVQDADTVTLTHPSYAIRELTRTGHTSWTLSAPTFSPTLADPTSITLTVDGADNNVTYRYQVTAIAENEEESLPGVWTAAAKTITAATKANPCVITSNSHGLSNGDEVEIASVAGMTELNGRRFVIGSVATNTFALVGEDSSAYTTYTSGGTATPTFVRTVDGTTAADNTIAWTAVTNAQRYAIYREKNGIFGLIGESQATSFADDNITPDTSLTPPRYRDPFRVAGSYPGCAGFYEQRRVFGGSNNAPDTSEYSRVGKYSNFTRSSPLQADDAITATLTSRQVNQIRHYIPGNDLLILTSGSEWRVNSGADSAFATETIKQRPQADWGSAHHRPINAGTTIVFVTADKANVRTLGYNLQEDRYTGVNLGRLAPHFLDGYTIEDWAYARTPDPVIFMVRNDGKVLALTFDREQEVVAWTILDTKGKFERVAVLRKNQADDEVYFVVKRTIGGDTARYVEYLHSRRFDDVRDCFFVDSGLSLDSPVTITGITAANPVVVTAAAHGFSNGDEVDIFDVTWTPTYDEFDGEEQPDQLNGRRYTVASATTNTFALTTSAGANVDGSAFSAYSEGGTARKAVLTLSGLYHLAGQSVVALCDGNTVSSLTVSATGRVTLPRKFSRVHIGLKYTADLKTLRIEAPQGTIQGKQKKISEVTVRFNKSRGMFIGPDFDRLTEMKQRENEAMGDPTALLTGDKGVRIEPSWNEDGQVAIRQRYPLPMTILAIIPDIVVGD